MKEDPEAGNETRVSCSDPSGRISTIGHARKALEINCQSCLTLSTLTIERFVIEDVRGSFPSREREKTLICRHCQSSAQYP